MAGDRTGTRALAEFLGTAILVATVVGSGIMGTDLSKDLAVALIANALATIAVLGTLIWMLGPVSGAHFNPVVSAVAVARGEMSISVAVTYVVAQVAGAVTGAVVANLMFGLGVVTASTHARDGAGMWLGEVVATAGLLLVIGTLGRTARGGAGPIVVPAWICAAYFFTSSTSFANPAVTIGRSVTDTFAGIAPESVAGFIVAQVVGAAIGAGLANALFPAPTPVVIAPTLADKE
jgi:glycerol uptake facilitator-like aquaporin